ncbi:hypothetical protein RvY_10048 [Ramazzottius varieornatus]|uniref:DUF659 domain-containing protein n=1 Tax=Ramazzottius varieornatus TaxID=947166 RepID=A0A1D1VFZ0_RAMVA|nr:hypothetical protein RvY_10048 [Ramazzottius varieornatus]
MVNFLVCFQVSCRQTARKLIVGSYKERKLQVIKELASVDGRFPLTLDMWKASARKQSYLVITLHWINSRWKMRDIIIDFIYIPKEHSGEHMKDVTIDALRKYKSAHKAFGVSTDGALSMVKVSELLQKEMEVDKRNQSKNLPEVPWFWNCCAAHTVHLVAKVATKKKDGQSSRFEPM